jgi:hypothetical protein
MKNGEEMVIYRFGAAPEPPRPRSLPSPPALSPLARRLAGAGLSRQAAVDLAAADPAECERQLQYLPHRGARDPGAVLGKAIREGWAAPPGWLQIQERQEAAAERTRKQAEASAQADRRAAAEAAFDRWWAEQTAVQQADLTARARERLRQENPTLIELTRRRPNSPVLQAALRSLLKEAAGWES